MDYKRIYEAFIKDRAAKPPTEGEYFEVHHILPRSLGGGDEPKNLIALKPEDHFFAHLLLAKICGGKMVAALWIMLKSSPKNWGRKEDARRSYGMARRLAIAYLKEKWRAENNPLFNDQKFEWAHYRSGEARTATLFDMHDEFGGCRSIWTQVAAGSRPSAFGWVSRDRICDHRRSEKGQVFDFVNRDGRTFSGTQGDFCFAHSVSVASGSRIVRGQSVTTCGWRLKGTLDRRVFAPKDGSRGSSTGKGKTYSLRHRDGRLFYGTSEDFRIAMGRPEGFAMSARLSQLMRGMMPSLYGWYIEKERQRTNSLGA